MSDDADKPLRDYRETVFLPTTPFPMRAGLPQAEPKLLEKLGDLYQLLRANRQAGGAPLYVLHDGPPYANGNIHMGTALNKILKELVVKSRSMAGYDAPFVVGYDCHGLPIELQVDRELGSGVAHRSQDYRFLAQHASAPVAGQGDHRRVSDQMVEDHIIVEGQPVNRRARRGSHR